MVVYTTKNRSVALKWFDNSHTIRAERSDGQQNSTVHQTLLAFILTKDCATTLKALDSRSIFVSRYWSTSSILGERQSMAFAKSDEKSTSASKARFFLIRDSAFPSPRSFTIGSILILSMISGVSYLILGPYAGLDAYSSMLYTPADCRAEPGWTPLIGHHCFGDALTPIFSAMQSDPWSGIAPTNYPASGLAIFWIFGHIRQWFGSQFSGGLYISLLAAAVVSPAIWAARASKGLEKIVAFLVCGAAAIPGWMALDRGNSIGFEVPILLGYLLALRRGKWTTVAIMVVLATCVKPQFALLGVALLAHRKWKMSLLTGVGVAITNILPYLLWPEEFPRTVARSIRALFGYGYLVDGKLAVAVPGRYNVSFVKGLFLVPDALSANKTGGLLPVDYLSSARLYVGIGLLLVLLLCLLVLGRRIPPLIMGIALLAVASLSTSATVNYYLVFAIPVAALIVRDPQAPPGIGALDASGELHRVAVFLISFSTSASIAQIPLPVPVGVRAWIIENTIYPIDGAGPQYVETTAVLTPLLWLATCLAIIVSYGLATVREPSTPRTCSAAKSVLRKNGLTYCGDSGGSQAPEVRSDDPGMGTESGSSQLRGLSQ